MITPEEHRRMNTVLLITITIALLIYISFNRHSIEDCEEKLFEKLTNMKHPKGVHD